MKLNIRADASAAIGFGHVMRCMALAEIAEERGIDVVFRGDYRDGAATAIAERGFDARGTDGRQWIDELEQNDIVIFDGYEFSASDYLEVSARGARVGAIDDLGVGTYPVDVLLHQNLAPHASYDLRPDTTVLQGPNYALVRREFRIRRRLRVGGRHLLVTLGGSDVAGLTQTVTCWAVTHDAQWRVTVLLGPGALTPNLPADVTVVRAPEDVGAVFDAADVAISAAGSTTWELLAMGVPTLLVQVADNQRHVGEAVADRGAAIFLGSAPDGIRRLRHGLDAAAETETQRQLSEAALELIDGEGADRVLSALMPV